MKQQTHRQQRNDGNKKRLEATLKRDSDGGGERGIGKRESRKGGENVKGQIVDCATKVGGQLCNVKAVKLNNVAAKDSPGRHTAAHLDVGN